MTHDPGLSREFLVQARQDLRGRVEAAEEHARKVRQELGPKIQEITEALEDLCRLHGHRWVRSARNISGHGHHWHCQDCRDNYRGPDHSGRSEDKPHPRAR